MADISHLEIMGRELKCPICLGLLNSAVSLTCNHAFCNSCIEKSMKLLSDCPVCKVPYRRREIRPAPHMDNLVSVYKSMEVASGVNIFITQNAASTIVPGEDNQTADNVNAQLGDLVGENQTKSRTRRSKSGSITKQNGSSLAKPSFPNKKRVQVPQYPTSETHMHPEKTGGEICETARKPQKCPVIQKDMTSTFEKREPILSPFFWLREDADLEKPSQQTDGDQEINTPPEIPCFSDIKDSDDDVPVGPDIVSNSTDFVDSEMFDWTQRPCSPELCSSPLAIQIQTEDTAEPNGAQEKAASTVAATGLKTSSKKSQAKDKRKMGKASSSNRRVPNATEPRISKRIKNTLCEVDTVNNESEKVINHNIQENFGSKNKQLILTGKTRKNKKLCPDGAIQERATEKVLTLSDGIEPFEKINKAAFIDFSASEDVITSCESKLKKCGQNGQTTKKKNDTRKKFGDKIEAEKYETENDTIVEQSRNVVVSHLDINMLPVGNDKVLNSNMTRKTCKKDSNKGMTEIFCEEESKKMPKSKKVKFSVEDRKKCNPESLSETAYESAKRGQTFQDIQGPICQPRRKIQAKVESTTPALNVNDAVLLKCKTFPSPIQCAFCQSSKESEASGIMVHYQNRQVVGDGNKTSDSLHVHKDCTEWAPNVYFEDDKVMNLENELSRSRRIKCSFCGMKGAALGCYEKSCRKSFHVPCARLTPECRWDYENFVMLCPIHATYQLPNEVSKSHSKQKRKRVTESKSFNDREIITDDCTRILTTQSKTQKKSKNLILCYSAFSNSEKEILNGFEKMYGVTVLKNWDSNVTHVIASTDENGACRRTLKFLMGVLKGKWILSIQWFKACMEAGELVDEQPYEVAVDIHGIRDGPRLGRLRYLNQQPKLFDGYEFFFMSDFAPSYKVYLHDLVIAAGGKVLNRKPIAGEQPTSSGSSATTFIVYSLELPEKIKHSNATSILNSRRGVAEALACSTGSVAASNSWILNSIAGYKLQSLEK